MSDQCLDDHGIVSEEAQQMSVGVVDGICNLHCTSYQENEPVKDTKPQELPQHLKVDGIFTEEGVFIISMHYRQNVETVLEM